MENKIFAQWGRLSLGSLQIALVLLLNLLAASPSLHKIFHADADQPQHQCAATLFAHGSVDAADSEVAAALPFFAIEFVSLIPVSVFGTAAKNLPPGRAPPIPSHNS